MFETSVLTINQKAYKKNLRFLRDQMGEKVRFCSIVKGNAYGHGISSFVKMANDCGIDYFGVYSTDEAFAIKKTLGNTAEILIMGRVDGDALEWAIQNELEFFVFDKDRLQNAVEIAKKIATKCKIHLEIETGMNRTGFAVSEIPELCQFLKENQEFISFKGICTHYAGAESYVNDERVQNQIQVFKKACNFFVNEGLNPEFIHSACSAAVINYPETISNMVRIGIMQYGFWPNEETLIRYNEGDIAESDKELARLIEWKSKVMTTKSVAKGDFIGYGTSYQAYADMEIAVIPVGYSYGYSRDLGNVGKVLIHGEEAPICGIVNMNAMCVDISHIPNVIKGDEVVMIGNQKGKTISVASFGEMSNQMNYELLTRLPQDIPRKIIHQEF